MIMIDIDRSHRLLTSSKKVNHPPISYSEVSKSQSEKPYIFF